MYSRLYTTSPCRPRTVVAAMDGGEELMSLRGVRFKETVVTEVRTVTPYRHFGIPPAPGKDSEAPLGPLTLFSFIGPARTAHELHREPGQLRHTLHSQFHTGIFLDTKEKGVTFPMIHFTDDRNSLKKQLSDEHAIDNDYFLYQGVYREVRSIRPEGVVHNGHGANSKDTAYILIGFKSLDTNFSQGVMVDSWKDWTGARYIYMYLPDELGLSRISFYQREAPDSLNMFLYVVLVECSTVHTLDHQMRLLDFAQRLRAERMTGYVCVYGVTAVN